MHMQHINKMKGDLADALVKYRSIVHTAPGPEVKAASDAVKALQTAIADAIVEGAKPCPTCGGKPHGMEQPGVQGVEYEIGCSNCGWFKDGDVARDHGARGGRLPRHTVETWNEGPEFWKTKPRSKFSDEEWAALPDKPAALK